MRIINICESVAFYLLLLVVATAIGGLWCQVGCVGRSGIEVAPNQEATSMSSGKAQSGALNLAADIEATLFRSELDSLKASIEQLGAVNAQVRSEVVAVKSDQQKIQATVTAGRDAKTTIKQNNPWPIVAIVALLSPSPASWLVKLLSQARNKRRLRKIGYELARSKPC